MAVNRARDQAIKQKDRNSRLMFTNIYLPSAGHAHNEMSIAIDRVTRDYFLMIGISWFRDGNSEPKVAVLITAAVEPL